LLGVGDAGNDIHMLEYAGLSVAMGNAFDDIKAIADYVTHSNEEDGVAHVIEKFILA
jgi:hydroxymethylpyrimidine pyrophosphatase-like HAD family hydrolase